MISPISSDRKNSAGSPLNSSPDQNSLLTKVKTVETKSEGVKEQSTDSVSNVPANNSEVANTASTDNS